MFARAPHKQRTGPVPLKHPSRKANTSARRVTPQPIASHSNVNRDAAELSRRRKPKINVKVYDVIELTSSEDEDEEVNKVQPAATPGVQDRLKRLQQELDTHKTDLAAARSETEAARLSENKRKEQHVALQREYDIVLQAKNASEAQLKQEMSKNKKKGKLDFSELEDIISCEICAGTMWEPCILPDCGHTFCRSCLQEWFSATLAKHMQENPAYSAMPPHVLNWTHLPAYNLNRHQLNLVEQYLQLQPHYTCPTCRRDVKSKPVDDFALKSLIRVIATTNGESNPKGETTVRRQDGGPWAGFFGV